MNLEWYPGAPYDNPKQYHWEMVRNIHTGKNDLVNKLDPHWNDAGNYYVSDGYCHSCDNR